MEKFLIDAMVAKGPSPEPQLPLLRDTLGDSIHGSVGGSVHGRKAYWHGAQQAIQQAMDIPDPSTYKSADSMASPRNSITNVLRALVESGQFSGPMGSIRNVRSPSSRCMLQVEVSAAQFTFGRAVYF
jgi:hypothetical protein